MNPAPKEKTRFLRLGPYVPLATVASYYSTRITEHRARLMSNRSVFWISYNKISLICYLVAGFAALSAAMIGGTNSFDSFNRKWLFFAAALSGVIGWLSAPHFSWKRFNLGVAIIVWTLSAFVFYAGLIDPVWKAEAPGNRLALCAGGVELVGLGIFALGRLDERQRFTTIAIMWLWAFVWILYFLNCPEEMRITPSDNVATALIYGVIFYMVAGLCSLVALIPENNVSPEKPLAKTTAGHTRSARLGDLRKLGLTGEKDGD